MPAKRFRTRARFQNVIQKPRGVIHPRVQLVGPEHFGIVSVDCAKGRFKWMFCDFYGNVLVPPTTVAHNRVELDAALAQLQEARSRSAVQDLLVAVERTGRYHHVPRNAFATVCSDVRTVHPFTSKQFRQASDPGVKTDDVDLAAIHRAAVNGFALTEQTTDLQYRELQLVERQRRDLAGKTTILCCQIREHLDAALPGCAACFADFWESDVALTLARHFPTAAALRTAGLSGLHDYLHGQQVRYQERTLQTILAWAEQAAPSDPAATWHHRIALALDEDRTRKTLEIQALERDLARQLVRTPYVLLLSFPGINVVSAADFAGELGAIRHYATAKSITGRAGLFPSRYQSDKVDIADGPLVRCANHRQRAVIMNIADNLTTCNAPFRTLATHWRAQGKDPGHSHVKIACRFCRIAYQMVAGQRVFHHPAIQQRHYILDKLNAFHRNHATGVEQWLADLLAAVEQRPSTARPEEAKPLQAEAARIEGGGRRGPQLLGDILPIVLARLGVGRVQSTESGEDTVR